MQHSSRVENLTMRLCPEYLDTTVQTFAQTFTDSNSQSSHHSHNIEMLSIIIQDPQITDMILVYSNEQSTNPISSHASQIKQ